MTKELEALKELRSYCEDVYYNKIYDKEYQIIETALKEYENLKKLKLLPYPKENDEEYRRNVIKRLQALEIIKEKRVDIRDLQECSNLEEYNEDISMNWNDKKEAEYHNELLTQEEYELLKEVLL